MQEIVMPSISDLLPIIMRNREHLFYRFHNFEHANRALMEEAGENNYDIISNFLTNEDENWFKPYPKIHSRTEGAKENPYNDDTNQFRTRVENKIENWILEDYEFHLSEFMDIIKDRKYSAEEFMECVGKPTMWCTVAYAPGGVYYTPIQWLSVLMTHDNYSNTEKLVDTELVDFLMFKDSYYNEECTDKELIESKMFQDIFRRDEFVYNILIGAFKFNFITYDCSYIHEGIHEGGGLVDWLPCGYQYLKKDKTP